MPSTDTWSSIVAAVRDPFSLAGLVVLVTMAVLRVALSKVQPLSGSAGYRIARQAITVVAVLALAVTLSAMGLRFYDVYTRSQNARPKLSRVQAEALLQANRGSIERCLSRLSEPYFYVDFVFTQGDDDSINLDVIPGEVANPDIEFLHPDFYQRAVEGYDRGQLRTLLSSSHKLSVANPDVNGCILSAVKDEVGGYALNPSSDGFVHRYITDAARR